MSEEEPKRLTKREEKQLAIVYGDSMEEEPKRKKYYCKDCGKKELVKVVYTEERCDNCDHINHRPHRIKVKRNE